MVAGGDDKLRSRKEEGEALGVKVQSIWMVCGRCVWQKGEMSFRMILSWVLLLGALVFCPASYGQWRLEILPEEAFSDPRQVALAKAAKAGDVKAINQAVKDGAEVKAVGRQRATALWYAVAANEKKAFARLLELGADPNQRS